MTTPKPYAPRQPGETRYQYEKRRTQALYGMTPKQLRRFNATRDATAAGYTPATTGLSQNQIINIWPRLRQMNAWASPQAQLTPAIILDAREAEMSGDLEQGWTLAAIEEKYYAVYEYKMNGDKTFGRAMFFSIAENYVVPPVWGFYH